MVKKLNVSLHGLESIRLVAWGIVVVLLGMIAYVQAAHAVESPPADTQTTGAQVTVTHTTHHTMTYVR